MYGEILDPGIKSYRPRVALAVFSSPGLSAIGQWGWDFHTIRGGDAPGKLGFRPLVVDVVDVWNDWPFFW